MTSTFFLPAGLAMPSIATVAEELRAQPLGGEVVLDASALTAPDLSVVQLLLSLRAEARSQGGDVRLSAPAGEALTALLHRGGFTDAMSPDDNAFWFHGVPLQ
jgi:anti-anti-sigma regulatory factor